VFFFFCSKQYNIFLTHNFLFVLFHDGVFVCVCVIYIEKEKKNYNFYYRFFFYFSLYIYTHIDKYVLFKKRENDAQTRTCARFYYNFFFELEIFLFSCSCTLSFLSRLLNLHSPESLSFFILIFGKTYCNLRISEH
jgi:hypothetical protein